MRPSQIRTQRRTALAPGVSGRQPLWTDPRFRNLQNRAQGDFSSAQRPSEALDLDQDRRPPFFERPLRPISLQSTRRVISRHATAARLLCGLSLRPAHFFRGVAAATERPSNRATAGQASQSGGSQRRSIKGFRSIGGSWRVGSAQAGCPTLSAAKWGWRGVGSTNNKMCARSSNQGSLKIKSASPKHTASTSSFFLSFVVSVQSRPQSDAADRCVHKMHPSIDRPVAIPVPMRSTPSPPP